jgi:hypothetical protein
MESYRIFVAVMPCQHMLLENKPSSQRGTRSILWRVGVESY